ncbi:hypothetical protein DOTSEDRAFT_71392 [Dothistroma septosporum NZE10]|uniref:Uncharacterized protein n=1 Tax=Dothistroma septosporum (strain NZE10 / CBS 128990) TaxID=675120 RepID=N1PQL4_DOTSN|nr:hypothetical protein DOTSEDRAFT_71392 [Dothistroma septosporum NZE10]
MDSLAVDSLVKQLTAGFDALQDEYQKLHGHNEALERKLATARDQYIELAKLYGPVRPATPSLSLTSAPGQPQDEMTAPSSIPEILEANSDCGSKDAATKVRSAIAAANELRLGLLTVLENPAHGVKIWSGPSADRPECSSSMMPSISESPLEQDFTVEGKPSKLGCPFASMVNKKLSSHAASVLSRYDQSGSVGAHGSVGASSTPASNTSRINGRDSFSQRRSRRASFVDPIKAEICALSDHDARQAVPQQPGRVESVTKPPTITPEVENAEVGVCPIRFLDQHSPEEVATYFEKHKHELPRSHEVCVMRYQSNDEQIKELDAKYGNLVSMIQGLGQKHKDYLPEDPDDAEDQRPEDALDDAKVRKWASSVSAQAREGDDAVGSAEERQPHFDRPLRDIRVGESPSRPWGVQVPLQYLERVDAASVTSSKAAKIATAAPADVPPAAEANSAPIDRPSGKCPFSHGAATTPAAASKPAINVTPTVPDVGSAPEATQFRPLATRDDVPKDSKVAPIIFNGPVFIGYSPEDAAKFLKETGHRMSQ